ncbi:hypothetical protein TGAM01_v201802, partial [Trichoderma gamsii]
VTNPYCRASKVGCDSCQPCIRAGNALEAVANTFGRRSAIVDSRSGDFGAHQAGITAARVVVTLQDEMLDVCITCPHASWVEGTTHRAALPGLEALEMDGFGLLEH